MKAAVDREALSGFVTVCSTSGISFSGQEFIKKKKQELHIPT
jgi:hypothetical protein